MEQDATKRGLDPAVPTPTAALVAYQEGSVVSRQLLKKAAGSITAFAFASGEGLTEHTTPYDAVVQVLEGETEVTVAGRAQLVRAGEWILMPGGEPHALRAITPFKMILTMIRA